MKERVHVFPLRFPRGSWHAPEAQPGITQTDDLWRVEFTPPHSCLIHLQWIQLLMMTTVTD